MKPRKKRKTKRLANSPLDDSECSGKSEGVSNGHPTSNNEWNVINGLLWMTWIHVTNVVLVVVTIVVIIVAVAFISQTCPSHSRRLEDSRSVTRTASPPQPVHPQCLQCSRSMMGNQPPEWAAQLIIDVKSIKSQVWKIEEVQQTVN